MVEVFLGGGGAAAAAAVLGAGNPPEKTSSLKMPRRELPVRAILATAVNLAASKTLLMPEIRATMGV